MAQPQSGGRTVAVCRSCQSMYVARVERDGTIRPIGVSDECTCGEGDFERFDAGAPSGGESKGVDG